MTRSVVGLQDRVRVLVVAPELRAGGLQQHQVLEAGDDPGLLVRALAVDGDDRAPDLLALLDPGVVVVVDPLPGVLLDLDPRAGDRLDVVDEVPGQVEAVVLDLADALLLGVRVAGLLLGVGRQHVGLVAGVVRRR